MSELSRADYYRIMCEARGIDTPCAKCSGTGELSYSSTATWRGGIGGQAFTSGVCCHCWGSGDAHRPWTNLRELEDKHRTELRKACASDVAKRCGATLSDMSEPVIELCAILDDVSSPRKRKVRPRWFYMLCQVLSRELKLSIGDEVGE